MERVHRGAIFCCSESCFVRSLAAAYRRKRRERGYSHGDESEAESCDLSTSSVGLFSPTDSSLENCWPWAHGFLLRIAEQLKEAAPELPPPRTYSKSSLSLVLGCAIWIGCIRVSKFLWPTTSISSISHLFTLLAIPLLQLLSFWCPQLSLLTFAFQAGIFDNHPSLLVPPFDIYVPKAFGNSIPWSLSMLKASSII